MRLYFLFLFAVLTGIAKAQVMLPSYQAIQFKQSAVVLAVGASYQGGIIAYILKSNDPGYVAGVTHGYIVTPTDLQLSWSDEDINTQARLTAPGAGPANTAKIVTAMGAYPSAAKTCSDLVFNGYDDWYMPSYFELVYILNNKALIGGFDGNGTYWSSTEAGASIAAVVLAYSSNALNAPKANAFYVRPTRSF